MLLYPPFRFNARNHLNSRVQRCQKRVSSLSMYLEWFITPKISFLSAVNASFSCSFNENLCPNQYRRDQFLNHCSPITTSIVLMTPLWSVGEVGHDFHERNSDELKSETKALMRLNCKTYLAAQCFSFMSPIWEYDSDPNSYIFGVKFHSFNNFD